MAVLLDQVHWGERVPSRELHSCSRKALVTPAGAALGEVLALASCCPQGTTSGLRRAACQIRLSAVAAVGSAARETMQRGREEGKSSL